MILRFKKVLCLNSVSLPNAAGFVFAIIAEPINKHLSWNKLVDKLQASWIYYWEVERFDFHHRVALQAHFQLVRWERHPNTFDPIGSINKILVIVEKCSLEETI